ncbi:MAG: hypothetical protein VYE04_09685 [Pseudomonadota bacterium]|nr:hypothetical protein [Pseudomonadota bacterium]
MSRVSMSRVLTLLSVVSALQAQAVVPNDSVANFRLFDHQGGSHLLHYFSDKKAVVLLVQDRSCSASQGAVQSVATVTEPHGDDVAYLVIDPTSSYQAVNSVHRSSPVPVLMDDSQLVGRTLDLNKAGEALVVNPRTWKLAYRGGLGDSLTQALAAVVEAREVSTQRTQVTGCDIVYAPTRGDEISYSQHIVPILSENCVSCHRLGGIGPWAMTDYNMVRGFSLMMREVLLTKRMPPWHADPTIGHWANDRSISRQDLQTLVAWIDAGAPRGEGADLLDQRVKRQPTWGALGEPDLIIDIPATEIPATGVVDYQYKYVTNPLDKDVWVRASQIVPGDRAVLHHVISRFGEMATDGPRKGRLKRRSSIGGGLAGYVPGAEPRELPEGTGTFLPAGATLEFQMHYTTTGVATTDHSRIGVYFHTVEPEHKIKAMILANGRIKIPPNADNHSEQAIREFERDALIYSILPHSHYRGKAARFVAHFPDGSREVLLNVPNYDFNWQTTYLLTEPKFMPAGTKIVYTNWWDNSAQNPANPNPNREVRWGRQSFDEMIFGAISYREINTSEGQDLAGSE